MATEIKIAYSGPVQGLSEHRLSITSFGKPLQLLLAALRRTASGLLCDAMGDDYGRRGGRFHRSAEAIDLELAQLEGGSAALSFIISLLMIPGQQMELLDTLPERAAVRLTEDLKAESEGRMRNAAVRKYLHALPGVSQSYTVVQDGRDIARADIGSVSFAEEQPELPHVVEFQGRVGGVIFEPNPAVRLIPESARQPKPLTASATAEMVEEALKLRGQQVSALAVADGANVRLLRVAPAEAAVPTVSAESEMEFIFARWGELLQRLAK